MNICFICFEHISIRKLLQPKSQQNLMLDKSIKRNHSPDEVAINDTGAVGKTPRLDVHSRKIAIAAIRVKDVTQVWGAIQTSTRQKILRDVENSRTQSPHLTRSQLVRGERYLFIDGKLNQTYRARVDKISDKLDSRGRDSVMVFLLDFGTFHWVRPVGQQFFELKNDLKSAPQQAAMFVMVGLEDFADNADVNPMARQSMEKKELLVQILSTKEEFEHRRSTEAANPAIFYTPNGDNNNEQILHHMNRSN